MILGENRDVLGQQSCREGKPSGVVAEGWGGVAATALDMAREASSCLLFVLRRWDAQPLEQII